MRFQTSGSTKTKTSKNRLTVNLEEDDTEVSIFGEEDIILVEYEETPKTPLNNEDTPKTPLNNEDTPKTPRNKGVKPRRQEAGVEDEEINIPEAIVIDLDTPTRKLEMEARVDLEKMRFKQPVMEFSKESRLSGSFRSTKMKKRKAEVEVEEVVEVIDEDDEEEWSPNLAKLLAKRSRLSQNLARQRRNNGKTRF